jgi:hypothetical protein
VLTVGQLKNIIRMLGEGEPRMTDDSPVRVDFLSYDDDVVMGPLGGAVTDVAYWSIDEEALSIVVRTERRVEL